jgi:hypothetical protein
VGGRNRGHPFCCKLERKNKGGGLSQGDTLGRSRKPEEEKVISISINLKKGTLDKIALEGKPKHIIERIINEQYEKK